jgi:PKD repeat protein
MYPQAPPSYYNASGSEAAILSNGDIAITGNDEEDFFTIVYTSGGAVKQGWPKKQTNPQKDDALAIAVDSDDNVIAGGYQTHSNTRKWYLVKYDADGTKIKDKVDDVEGEIKRLTVDESDNSIIAVGYRMDGTDELFCVRKYDANLDLVWEGQASNPPAPATADFHWVPQTPKRNEYVHFISDSTGEITSFYWDFGDGSESFDEDPWHQYGATGQFTVNLTATTSQGTRWKEKTVTVVNAPPTATFTYQPGNPVEGEQIAFDASGSSDTDGSIAGYAWNFGDGSQGTGQTATHTYATASTYTVTLTVTDNEGATRQKVQTITVNQPSENDPPLPTFTVSDENPTVGDTVTFDASGSEDPDGTIVFYRWDWDGDGTYDTSDFTQPTATHRFFSAGTYNVTLQVEDNGTAKNTFTREITVKEQGQTQTLITLEGPTTVEVNKDEVTSITITLSCPLTLTGVGLTVVEDANSVVNDTGGTVNLTAGTETTVNLSVQAAQKSTVIIKAEGDGEESDTMEITINIKDEDSGSTPAFTFIFVCAAIACAALYFRRRHG